MDLNGFRSCVDLNDKDILYAEAVLLCYGEDNENNHPCGLRLPRIGVN